LQALAADHALALRGGSLSLGSAGPLDGPSLEWLAGLIEISRPLWLSEPIGFWRSSEMTLADVCPIRFDFANLELLAEHARAAQERLRVPLLLENVASPLRIRGTLADAEFLNRLCEASSCRLLVDLGALVAQARGHGFDAEGWLRELAPANVGALRLASCPRRWSAWLGESGAALWEATWELARSALLRLRPAAVLLAYDEGLPHPSQLAPALARLAQLAATGGAAGAR
jgi:hypothetical protein